MNKVPKPKGTLRREDLKKPRKVLLAAHEENTHRLWIRNLEMRCPFGSIAIINASSPEEVEKKLQENPDISVIVIEACFAGNFQETVPFIEKLQKTFEGHLVFASNVMHYRKKVEEHAECPHTSSIHSTHRRVIEVLGLNHL